MSYSQFGYTYPSSSQILVSSPHPMSVSPCCPASGPGPAVADAPGGGAGEARLLSPFPRLAPAGFGLYGYAADPHLTSALSGSAPSAFYPSLPSPYDLKESRSSWSALQPSSAAACYPYDPSGLAPCGPYGDRYSTIDSVARRKNATRETTNTLKAWLYEHRKNPYPTKGEKIMLAIITKMTLTQVSTWFANARRRLKKENKMTWEPRNKTSEGDDRDSSSPRDNKSDDNTNEEDSNLTPAAVTNIDFLKQESEGLINKHGFSEFEDPTLEPKSINHPGKTCIPYGINCYRPQSSEDSGTSDSPSPARPLQMPCYGDGTHRFDPGKNEQKDAVYCDSGGSFGSRPKIWSLARTATSNSPPLIRKYQCPVDYCLEGDLKENSSGDCAKIKTAGYSCSVPYPEFGQDRTTAVSARKNAAENLCCDRSVYGNILSSCGVPPTKCETADCLGLSDRNSCMIKNQCNYAAEYPANMNNGTEHYSQFKNKDLCAIEYSTTKCQPLDSSVDNQTSKKLTSTIMPYPGSDPGGSGDFFSGRGGFDQTQATLGTLHKGASNQSGIEIPDSGPLLRRNDH